MTTAPGPQLPPPHTGNTRVRVLVVDDSVVIRNVLTKILQEDPALEVVGVARNGEDALNKVPRLLPDAITLDVAMPELDGLSTLKLLQKQHPHVKVIMCSSRTERGARETVEALMAGASDYVSKQSNAFDTVATELRSKILALFPNAQLPAARPPVPQRLPARAKTGRHVAPRVLAIGVSTGGPAALMEVVPRLPAGFPLPVVIVQHMPPVFTGTLASRLAETSAVPVCEAKHGMPLLPGHVYIAPGDFHMMVVERRGELLLELNQEPRENSCRPAVDVLFRSVARVFGENSIGMILTGMGRDGLLGVGEMKAKGAHILVQDAATSVVWGMPGAVAEANLADNILPLGQLVQEVLRNL